MKQSPTTSFKVEEVNFEWLINLGKIKVHPSCRGEELQQFDLCDNLMNKYLANLQIPLIRERERERETLLLINDIQLFKREKDIEPNFEVTSSPTWCKVLEVRKRSVSDE